MDSKVIWSSSLSEVAAGALGHVTVVPGWSLAAQVVVGAGVLAVLQALRGSRRFSVWNEFLCTLLWVCWSLETSVIGFASSTYHANFTLFVRLLLWPLLVQDALVNPLNAVYLAVEEKSIRKIPLHLFIQLTAMVTALLYCMLSWQLLGSWLSHTHFDFMSSSLNPFLTVTMTQGFMLELGMSFVAYLPRLVMSNGFTCTFTSAALTCFLILLLEHTTGAFMNPLTALAASLLWHSASLTAAGACEFLFVYWLAPIIGTILMARLDVWLKTSRRKPHAS